MKELEIGDRVITRTGPTKVRGVVVGKDGVFIKIKHDNEPITTWWDKSQCKRPVKKRPELKIGSRVVVVDSYQKQYGTVANVLNSKVQVLHDETGEYIWWHRQSCKRLVKKKRPTIGKVHIILEHLPDSVVQELTDDLADVLKKHNILATWEEK